MQDDCKSMACLVNSKFKDSLGKLDPSQKKEEFTPKVAQLPSVHKAPEL